MILITGGAGYIGSHCAYAAIDAGYGVIVLDNLSTGCRSRVPEQAIFIQGDVGDEACLADLFARYKVETIIHFAGVIKVDESVRLPEKYFHENTAKSITLIRYAIANAVQEFIFSSTAAVYGEPEVDEISVSTETRPINPYGHSKLLVEKVLQDVCASHEMNYGILRYFNVAGVETKQRTGPGLENATHLVRVACQAAIGYREQLQIYGNDYPTPDGTCIRDYIHVSDLVEAHLATLAFLRDSNTSCIFNCGMGRGFSVNEVVSSLNELIDGELNVQAAPRRAGDPARLVADTSCIRAKLAWRPRYTSIQDIIASALSWEKLSWSQAAAKRL